MSIVYPMSFRMALAPPRRLEKNPSGCQVVVAGSHETVGVSSTPYRLVFLGRSRRQVVVGKEFEVLLGQQG